METKLIMLYRDWSVRFSSVKLQGTQAFSPYITREFKSLFVNVPQGKIY